MTASSYTAAVKIGLLNRLIRERETQIARGVSPMVASEENAVLREIVEDVRKQGRTS